MHGAVSISRHLSLSEETPTPTTHTLTQGDESPSDRMRRACMAAMSIWRHAPLSLSEEAPTPTPTQRPTRPRRVRAAALLLGALLATVSGYGYGLGLLRGAGGTTVCQVYGICEVRLSGDEPNDPFALEVFGTFVSDATNASFHVRGFYDGDGVFAVRFSPNAEGAWRYTLEGDMDAFKQSGTLVVVPAPAGQHGPVRADGRFLRHADGTLHLSFGTTCYAWAHQSDAMREATLTTLRSRAGRAVNKIRMTILPKWYPYTKHDPALFPFRCRKQQGCSRSTGGADGWDFRSFDPSFWRDFETLVARLRDEDIIADLILFHPYDGGQWGFDCMGGRDSDTYDTTNDAHYLRYAVARLGAFSNVWWSMANEFDLVDCKRAGIGQDDAKWGRGIVAEASPVWDQLFAVLEAEDPYPRERSIHNGRVLYDPSRRWVDHVSMQGNQPHTKAIIQASGNKPLIWDEVKYEGDIPQGWGALSGPGMADQFWRGLSLGVHVGHGETILQPGVVDDEQQLWWSKGGELRGTSLLRVAWLRAYLTTIPEPTSLEPREFAHGECSGTMLVRQGEFALFHLREAAKCTLSLPGLPTGTPFRATTLNWWEMTTTLLANVSRRSSVTIDLTQYGVRLPSNVELRRLDDSEAGPPRTFVPASRDEALRCYAARYPDLFEGYCHSKWERCQWTALGEHYDNAGPSEGRELGCDLAGPSASPAG